MNSYRPSWYVPLHRAAKDIANQQDRQLREVELWLCEQVELGKVHVILLDKHERECEIRRSQWRRGGMDAVQRGVLYDHSSDRLPVKLRVYIHKEELAAILAPKSLGAKRRPPPPHAKLVAFLFSYADGRKTETDCRRAAEEHFDRPIPDAKPWRNAWRKVPPEQKRPRGAPAAVNPADKSGSQSGSN